MFIVFIGFYDHEYYFSLNEQPNMRFIASHLDNNT